MNDDRQPLHALHAKHPALVPEGWHFEHGPGWASVLDRFFEDVAAAGADAGNFRLTQVKEKYGEIRIYYHCQGDEALQEAVDRALTLAEARSVRTCERCGEPGRLRRKGHWLLTACDGHADGAEPFSFDVVRLSGAAHDLAYDEETDSLVPAPQAAA